MGKNIREIIDSKNSDIDAMGNDILLEIVGVKMALDKLSKSVEKIKAQLDAGRLEKASQTGYGDLAEQFVYVQRTLGGLQTEVNKKDAFISAIAMEANAAYEDIAPLVEARLQSVAKKER